MVDFFALRFAQPCATFFISKSGTLIFFLFRYNYIRRTSALTSITCHAFAVPSSCLRFRRRKQGEDMNKAGIVHHQTTRPTTVKRKTIRMAKKDSECKPDNTCQPDGRSSATRTAPVKAEDSVTPQLSPTIFEPSLP